MDEHERKTDACEDKIEQLVVQLQAEHFDLESLEKLCAENPRCANALRQTYSVWQDLTLVEVPEPSANMHARFYKTLSQKIGEQQRKTSFVDLFSHLKNWINTLHPAMQWGLIFGVFILGLFIGQAPKNNHLSSTHLPSLSNHDAKAFEKLTYIDHQKDYSASERMQAVNEMKNIKDPNSAIIEALNQVLLHDPNVNVRLSAVESLFSFSSRPLARKVLIQAIPRQESGLVLVALAEGMLALNEKESLDALQEIVKEGDVENDVRYHLQETITDLLNQPNQVKNKL